MGVQVDSGMALPAPINSRAIKQVGCKMRDCKT
jgi:hypothetical protein